MQTHTASERSSSPVLDCLHQESDGLQAMHRGWTQRVAAWRLAHEAAAAKAEGLLARMDALIARLEAR